MDRISRISVNSGGSAYDALIGSKLLEAAGSLVLDKLRPGRCAIITDANTAPLFATSLQQTLTQAGFRPSLITIPPGEHSKTLDQVRLICDRMVAGGLDRQSFVVGLGGGVIGDLSGFTAAIFHRGIPHVQMPTTLLAMVDSSIGGKTGVNTGSGKNLIGAVHHPVLVIDDIDVLQTLPEREFRQGFAEIIKHSIIRDQEMFEMLRTIQPSELRPTETNRDMLGKLIRRNVEIKAAVVAQDERDRTGNRALLNFGHTVGHGIERAGNYDRFMHGEAISLGMIAAAFVSIKRAGLAAEQRDAMVDILRRFDLPTRLPADFSRDRILDALKFDKKFEQGKIRYVVTPRIGAAYLSSDVTWEDIREAVAEL